MTIGTTLTPPPPFSWLSFLTMLVVLTASVAVYVMLVRRWTSRRQWVSLAEWTRESGFRLRPARRDALPGPLVDLVHSDAQVRFHLWDPRTALIQFETDPQQGGAAPPKWNVLVRHRAAPGAAAGLRPGGRDTSLIDLLPLGRFPTLSLGDRFVVHGQDSRAARKLADSPAVALLPQDLGLVLTENHFILDFSTRPFDPIEFGRVMALADQLQGMGG